MAIFHLEVGRIVKGVGGGGGAGFAKYIARVEWREARERIEEQQSRVQQHAQYLARESHPQKEDLVKAGHANLPQWATDNPVHFFAMAEKFERKNGIVARIYEISLPRELPTLAREALADDIRATFFNQHPHAWAIHCPPARDGADQPHVHVIVSERLVDGIERRPKDYFARAAVVGRLPEEGGARKELAWTKRSTLRGLRGGVATLTNAALERAGCAVAISGETLQARGYDREPEQYHKQAGWKSVQAYRHMLNRDYHPFENEMNVLGWHQQKAAEHIRDISREAMVDHVRDRFWLHDQRPARSAEREASVERFLVREWTRTPSQERPGPHGRTPWEHTPALHTREQGARRVTLLRRGGADARGVEMDDTMHAGTHVRLRDEAWERER